MSQLPPMRARQISAPLLPEEILITLVCIIDSIGQGNHLGLTLSFCGARSARQSLSNLLGREPHLLPKSWWNNEKVWHAIRRPGPFLTSNLSIVSDASGPTSAMHFNSCFAESLPARDLNLSRERAFSTPWVWGAFGGWRAWVQRVTPQIPPAGYRYTELLTAWLEVGGSDQV